MYPRWYDKPLTLILKIEALFVIFIPLAIILIKPVYIYNEIQKSKVEDEVHIGTVTDKKIINASRGLFTSSDKRYQIVISFEYEYDGKNYESKRSIDVDEDVYLSYDVGDIFDSHNPVPKEERTEKQNDSSS